jgi:hypothetical protein
MSRMSKLPESTRRKQAIFNKGSLFYSHCARPVVHSPIKPLSENLFLFSHTYTGQQRWL